MIIRKSTIAVTRGVGVTATPQVSLRHNGQIGLNRAASEYLGDFRHAVLDFDSKTRTMTLTGVDPKSKKPKYLPADFAWPTDLQVLKYAEKMKSIYFAASGVLKDQAVGIEYDYKSAGNQAFSVEGEEGKVSFVIPAETPKAKPVTKRGKRTNGAVPGAVATAAKASGGGGTQATLEEVD